MNVHKGYSEAVRQALTRSAKPLSVYQLQLATGLDPETIKRTLWHLFRYGGAVGFAGRGTRVYTVPSRAPKPEPIAEGGEFAIAGKICVGRGLKWGI